MATIKAIVRSKAKKAYIRLRLVDGRNAEYFGKTKIVINPQWWNSEKEELKNRLIIPGVSKDDINSEIKDVKKKVLDYYRDHKDELEKDWITKLLAGELEKTETVEEMDFFQHYSNFMSEKKVSPGRLKQIKVVKGMLERFSLVRGITLNVNTFNYVTDFESFLRDEHKFYTAFPDIYKSTKKIKPRGQNTITYKLNILKTFFSYLHTKKITTNDPFESYEFVADVYADPLPILPEEFERLYKYIGLTKALMVKKKVFCLHCLVGCRVADFMKLTNDNINDDILFYIPEKTFKESPKTVYVPLVNRALKLIKDLENDSGFLVPRMSLAGDHGYNKSIKEIAKAAGLTRKVQTINPLTQKTEIKELWEVMTSHTARKTFINCNYIEAQDPALISKMTGHSPHSRAFERYRNLDIELLKKQMKKAFGE